MLQDVHRSGASGATALVSDTALGAASVSNGIQQVTATSNS
jgi:hypothetical protein